MFLSHRPDLLILDLGLPDLDGTEVIKQVREEAGTPIIILSARTNEADKVKALDWNGLELVTEETVGYEITSIGIRAHDFEALSQSQWEELSKAGSVNLILVENPKVSEMPFEWYVTLENGLWWKKEKGIHTHDSVGVVPAGLRVEPSALLLLKES